MTDLTLNIVKTIHAPIEKVFDAWLDPVMMSKFMRGRPEMPQSDVENDAREGGGFTVIMHLGDESYAHTGKYLEISRPDKLVFTWASRWSPDDSTVTLTFTKVDDHNTEISLTQVRFIDEETRSAHEEGWGHVLDRLNEAMTSSKTA